MVSFARSSRADAWAATSQNEMAQLNGMVQGGNQGQFSEPVIGGNALSLFFMFSAGGGVAQVVESRWDGVAGEWLPANPFSNAELTSDAQHRKRPTGASTDGRTLFFFDESAGHERGAWRNSPTSPFNLFQDVAVAPEASPNRFCGALYYQGEGAVAAGLYEAQ
jgi:hypothetical protein